MKVVDRVKDALDIATVPKLSPGRVVLPVGSITAILSANHSH